MKAVDLQPGDRFYVATHNTHAVILRESEEAREPWGTPLVKFWATREDTGAEGYVMFGLNAEVPA